MLRQREPEPVVLAPKINAPSIGYEPCRVVVLVSPTRKHSTLKVDQLFD